MKTDDIGKHADNKIGWKHKFFNEVPMVDKDGKPMQQDPPLNTGFFLKKHDTAGALRDHIESIKTERSQRRSGNQTIRFYG